MVMKMATGCVYDYEAKGHYRDSFLVDQLRVL